MINISVAILAFNEEGTIETVTREVVGTLASIEGDHEVLIINDGSRDETGEIAARLERELSQVNLVNHGTNLGLGGVYRSGFREARGDALTFWPADGQFDPDIIREFASLIGSNDLVLGYLPNRKRGLLPGLLSLGERSLYRILFGKLPKFQGVLMLRTSLLSEFELISEGRGWVVMMEFIIRVVKGGKRITSVPTELRPRAHGGSKVTNVRTILSNLKHVLKLRSNF